MPIAATAGLNALLAVPAPSLACCWLPGGFVPRLDRWHGPVGACQLIAGSMLLRCWAGSPPR